MDFRQELIRLALGSGSGGGGGDEKLDTLISLLVKSNQKNITLDYDKLIGGDGVIQKGYVFSGSMLDSSPYTSEITLRGITEFYSYSGFGSWRVNVVSLPNCVAFGDTTKSSTVAKYTFDYATVNKVLLDKCKYLSGGALFRYGHTHLLYAPQLESIGSAVFKTYQINDDCTYVFGDLTHSVATLDFSGMFGNSSSYTRVIDIIDAANVTTTGTTYVDKFIVRNETHMVPIMVSLANVSFNEIYVADSLVDTYKADSLWSIFADKIKPLSTYPIQNREDYKTM